MIYATKIRMRPGSHHSQSLTEISHIYLTGLNTAGFYDKEDIHMILQRYPGTIQVGIPPFPNVVPAVSPNGEKYVKSSPNAYGRDNLLSLPRE